MAEKSQQVHPLAPAYGYPRSDEESASTELRKKKRMKCLAYIAIFAVFQTIIIVVFVLAVVRIKTPKIRLDSVTVGNSTVNGNRRLSAQVTVRNTNFGHYRFESSTATLTSGGATVGQFIIPEGRARARSTKRVDILVEVNPTTGGGDTVSGVLAVRSEAEVRGRVVFVRVLKRRRSAAMSCTMSINLNTNAIQDLMCR